MLILHYAHKTWAIDVSTHAIHRAKNGRAISDDFLTERERRYILEIMRIVLRVGWQVEAIVKAVAGVTYACAMCGTPLTDPVSRSRGVGPDCWTKIGGKAVALRAQLSR